MGRFIPANNPRGSLDWIQKSINQTSPRSIDAMIVSKLGDAKIINWKSPLANDDYAEYRDIDFLKKIGAAALADQLQKFWPASGPQWDALGVTDADDILLVEAKAHIGELLSSPSQAGVESRLKIDAALDETACFLTAEPRVVWADTFYQLANRVAHLYFLRKHGLKAWLVLVNFLGDRDMKGPDSAAEWEAAYAVIWYVLGIPRRNPLEKYIVHVYPQVSELQLG
jgi:hypothetical protein